MRLSLKVHATPSQSAPFFYLRFFTYPIHPLLYCLPLLFILYISFLHCRCPHSLFTRPTYLGTLLALNTPSVLQTSGSLIPLLYSSSNLCLYLAYHLIFQLAVSSSHFDRQYLCFSKFRASKRYSPMGRHTLLQASLPT